MLASGEDAGFSIQRSLRFSDSDSAVLKRTFAAGGNRTTWTWSGWLKRSKLANTTYRFFACGNSTNNNDWTALMIDNLGRFKIGAYSFILRTSVARYRDPAAWMHIVVAADLNQGSDANKYKAWVNGELVEWEPIVYNQTTSGINMAAVHTLGAERDNPSGNIYNHYDGLMAEVHFLDGTAVSSPDGVLGEFDTATGVWSPIEFTGSHGSNGFYLPFSPDTALTHPNKYATQGNSGTPPSNAASLTYSTGNYLASNQGVTYDAGSVRKFWVQPGTSDPSVRTSNNGTSWTTIFDGSQTWNEAIEVNCRYVYMSSSGSNFGIYYDQEAVVADASGADNHWLPVNLQPQSNNNNSLSSYSRTGHPAAEPTSKFLDGDAATSYTVVALPNTTTTTSEFTFGTNLSGTLEVLYQNGNSQVTGRISIDGGVNYTALGVYANPTWVNIGTINGNNVRIRATFNSGGGSTSYWHGIRVNGVNVITADSDSGLDNLFDSPTNYDDGTNVGGNYATLNPLQTGSGLTLSNGNLDLDGTSSWKSSYSSIFLSSGKWYTEYTIRSITSHSYGIMVGLAGLGTNSIESEIGSSGDSYAIQNGPGDMKVNYNGTSSGQGPQAAYAVGDVLQLAWDADNGKLFLGKNGSWINSANPVTGANAIRNNLTGTYCFAVALLTASDKISANFGQRPFAYTPPTGYKSLCTTNLDDPLIADGSKAFAAITWSGDSSSSRTIPTSFEPGFVWVKNRSVNGRSHYLYDVVRGFGANKEIVTDTNDEEGSNNHLTQNHGYVSGTTATGFTLAAGATNSVYTNESGQSYVGWAWDGGDLATNSAYNQDRTWSDGVTFSGSIMVAGTSAFDGNPATSASPYDGANGGGTPQWVQVTFSPGVPYTSSVKVERQNGNASNVTVAMNGGTPINSAFQAYTTVATGSGTLTSIKVQNNGSSNTAGISRIEVDGKVLVDKGVIPVGSLNSSAYNSGEVWSTTGTLSVDLNGSTVTNITGALSKAFEGSLASSSMVLEGSAYTNGTKTFTYTFGTAQTNITSARVYLYQGNSAEGGAAGFGNGTVNKTQDGTYGWVDASSTIPANGTVTAMTMTTTATSGVNSARNGFIAIELNGKMLLDNNVTPVDNFPSVASTCSINQTAGLSICSYTATGSELQVAHGLNKKPTLIFLKSRNVTGDWLVMHNNADVNKFLKLNSTQKEASASNVFTSVTDSLFATGNDSGINTSGQNKIAFCFTPSDGFCATGTYEGNYSFDGSFQYTGFRVAFLLWKNIDQDGFNWGIIDSTRGPYNYLSRTLNPNTNGTESNRTEADAFDFLSNGFKVRATGSNARNQNGSTFTWIAFAENPFKIARAR